MIWVGRGKKVEWRQGQNLCGIKSESSSFSRAQTIARQSLFFVAQPGLLKRRVDPYMNPIKDSSIFDH